MNNPLPNETDNQEKDFVSRIIKRYKPRTIIIVLISLPFLFILTQIFIKLFIFEAYKISSDSMRNTLQVNDRVFVKKIFFTPELGDIVVFKTEGIPPIEDPDRPYRLRRIAGLPGDTLEITEEGQLLRNGEPLTEPEVFADIQYEQVENEDPFIEKRCIYKIPDDRVFVLGDYTRNSFDSRYFGGIPIENLIGEVIIRYWPPTRWRTFEH